VGWFAGEVWSGQFGVANLVTGILENWNSGKLGRLSSVKGQKKTPRTGVA